jgi:hypothetical protein
MALPNHYVRLWPPNLTMKACFQAIEHKVEFEYLKYPAGSETERAVDAI